MGNFEKLVVLTVLFLSAIVLAISLNDGDKKAAKGSPMERVLAGAPASTETARGAGRPASEAGPGVLLSTEVVPATTGLPARPSAGPALPTADRDGRAPLLRSTEGLRKAGLDDYMVYTAVTDDTWTALSERFYGSGRHVSLLRHANEDMVSPIADETILVPVYDFTSEAGQRAPLAPETTLAERAPARPALREESAPRTSERPAATTVLGGDLTDATKVTVGPGDSLSGIALRVYGSAARWNVLYEANRGVLKSPDWLTVGTELVVPRGAELQAVTQRAAASAPVATAERSGGEAEGTSTSKGKVR